ncbi:hypothetical protein NQD34_010367 [Periophthalmus magnuspinnatus]|nr:hypothetical protein NQD34_010367 [Periophthalmus magnuspinnatus]
MTPLLQQQLIYKFSTVFREGLDQCVLWRRKGGRQIAQTSTRHVPIGGGIAHLCRSVHRMRKKTDAKFKMEPAVEKLEALFQKSEADLDYIEKRLKLDFINTASESGCTAQENPVAMLEHLRAIKARHAALSSQVQELASEQRQTMDSLRANMEQAVEVLSQLQNTAQLKEPQDAALPGQSS